MEGCNSVPVLAVDFDTTACDEELDDVLAGDLGLPTDG